MCYQDKVCQLSGINSSLVEKNKVNFIQIHPKAKKLFKGKKASLVFFDKDLCVKSKGQKEWQSFQDFNSLEYLLPKERIVKLHNYYLVTDDPKLLGIVDGLYMGQTFNKSATIRKIKRLVGGSKNLRVVNTNFNIYEVTSSELENYFKQFLKEQ